MTSPKVPTLARSRTARGARQRLALRAMATLAALVVALSAWMPWVSAVGTVTLSGHTRRVALQLSPGDVHDVAGTFVWSALTVMGALICPLLWARRGRLVSMLAVVAYAAWVLAFTGFATSRFEALFRTEVILASDIGIPGLDVASQRQLLPGLFLGCAGIALSLVSCFALFLDVARPLPGVRREHAFIPVRSMLPAAGALTASLLLWIIATLVVPWATLDCAGAPLLFGHCTGIPFNAALGTGIRSTTAAFDPLAAKFAAPVLLTGSAALMLVAVWRRRLTRRLCVWISLWLVVSGASAALADAGVSAVIANPAAQSLPAGTWSGDNGIACAVIALLLGTAGVVYLWIAALRSRPELGRDHDEPEPAGP
jgi:hypothetical protein